jgi:hypothetical protein
MSQVYCSSLVSRLLQQLVYCIEQQLGPAHHTSKDPTAAAKGLLPTTAATGLKLIAEAWCHAHFNSWSPAKSSSLVSFPQELGSLPTAAASPQQRLCHLVTAATSSLIHSGSFFSYPQRQVRFFSTAAARCLSHFGSMVSLTLQQ